MSVPAPLPVEELAHRCDAGQFAFASTDELEDIGVIPGQERATDAIELAVGIERDGYNLFPVETFNVEEKNVGVFFAKFVLYSTSK